MPALVSISCAVVLDQFPFKLVAGIEVHCESGIHDSQQLEQFCSFLDLFAPVHAQKEKIRSTAQTLLPAALLLLEHWQCYNIILMLQKES
jgi:hypothetical protein